MPFILINLDHDAQPKRLMESWSTSVLSHPALQNAWRSGKSQGNFQRQREITFHIAFSPQWENNSATLQAQSEKLQITKITPFENWNYKTCSPHIPVIKPIYHCTAIPCPVKIMVWVIQPYWSLHRARVNSVRVIQLQRAYDYVITVKLSPRDMFHCNFSECVIFHRCQTWTIYGLWRKILASKCRWENPQKGPY